MHFGSPSQVWMCPIGHINTSSDRRTERDSNPGEVSPTTVFKIDSQEGRFTPDYRMQDQVFDWLERATASS